MKHRDMLECESQAVSWLVCKLEMEGCTDILVHKHPEDEVCFIEYTPPLDEMISPDSSYDG